jgi:hypothetical protein
MVVDTPTQQVPLAKIPTVLFPVADCQYPAPEDAVAELTASVE